MSSKFELSQGMVITCPNPYCGHVVGRVMKRLKAGDKMTREHLSGPMIRFGELPRCLDCGHRWYFEEDGGSGNYLSRIHLARGGWFPSVERIKKGA